MAEYAHLSVSGSTLSVSGSNLSVSGSSLSVSGSKTWPNTLRLNFQSLSVSGQ